MKENMGNMDIAFPNLGIYLENVPKEFHVFGFMIAYYGVIIGIAVMLGFALVLKQAKLDGQDPEMYWDFSIYAIIFSIIGARVYFVIFTWDSYQGNLLDMINIRGGGLAIYGAVIAAFLTALIYTKIKKISLLRLLDVGVTGLLIGQIIGRWANFINREAFGGYTDNLFAMRIPLYQVRFQDISTDIAQNIVEGTNYIQVHPTFLYESLGNVVVLTFILLYRKHKKFTGELTLLYLGGYGLVRFFVEGLRTDQLILGSTGIAVSQLLGLLLFFISCGIGIVVRLNMHKNKIIKKIEET